MASVPNAAADNTQNPPTDSPSEKNATSAKPPKSVPQTASSASPLPGPTVPAQGNGSSAPRTPRPNSSSTDAQGLANARMILRHVQSKGGEFIRDDDDGLSIRVAQDVISLAPGEPQRPNVKLNLLLEQVCQLAGVTTPLGRATLAALQTIAHVRASKLTSIRRFSALSKDGNRVYVPAKDGVVCVTAEGIARVENTLNPDQFTIEPAKEQEPFTFVEDDPKAGLKLFEELVINSLAVQKREMGYLLAVQLLLFPYFRGDHQDRFISLLKGPSGEGKSTGERIFSRLQGWDELRGDFSVPALEALGDCGVLFLDNKEDKNLDSKFSDWLIFAATGADRGRATRSGELRKRGSGRPVVAMTSIEGPSQTELVNRCVEFKFRLVPEAKGTFSERELKRRIQAARDKILSALLHVVRKHREREERADISSPLSPVPKAAERFADNWHTDCKLLRAYAEVAGKPAGWADEIIGVWSRELAETEAGNEEVSTVVRGFLGAKLAKAALVKEGEDYFANPKAKPSQFSVPELIAADVRYGGQAGKLYVTQCSTILAWAHESGYPLNMKVTVLGSRLSEINAPDLRVLRENDVEDQNDPNLRKLLKRHAGARPVGFFVPSEKLA